MTSLHQVKVRDGSAVAGVQALIEARLGVVTHVEHNWIEGCFCIEWSMTPPVRGADLLDFLRPHVLPPR